MLTHHHKHQLQITRLIVLVAILFLCTQVSFAQQFILTDTARIFSSEIYEPSSNKEYLYLRIENINRIALGTTYNPQLNENKLFHPELKSMVENTILLDSVLVKKRVNETIVDVWKKWYYHYDKNGHLSKIEKYFYNEKGKPDLVFETETYDNEGHLLKHERKEADNNALSNDGDTLYYSIINEYEYENANLIKAIKTDESRIYSTGEIVKTLYTYSYNEKNLLIQKVYESSSGLAQPTNYYYDTNDRLEYEVRMVDPTTYDIIKHEEQKTDSTHDISINRIWLSDMNTEPVLDSIFDWSLNEMYFRKLDEYGRTSSVISKGYSIWSGLVIDFKAEYTYTDSNKLLHASYYNWEGDIENGSWKESLRIDHTYDNDDRILVSENYFYNNRFLEWNLDEKRRYYYSFYKTFKTEICTEFSSLKIFPNPANDWLCVTLPYGCAGDCSIVNSSGGTVLNACVVDNTIDISSLKKGLYFVRFNSGSSVETLKFIKQ